MKKIDDGELVQMLKEGRMTQKEMAEHFGCSEPAITKRKKRYRKLGFYNEFEVPEAFGKLDVRKQKFVLARVDGKNQTQAALEAFECGTHASAKTKGCELMKDNDIQKAISEIMQEEGLTRRYRIKRLKYHVDNRDPNVSLKALDQTWKLDGAYTEKHVNVNISYADMVRDLEEMNREIKQLETELGMGGDDSEVIQEQA